MFKVTVLAWLILLPFSNVANAETEFLTPDVIACLKAVDTLDTRYRSSMQQHFLSVACNLSINVDKGRGLPHRTRGIDTRLL